MKLYYAPGACSLGPHIVANEAKLPVEFVKTDIRNKTIEGGGDYLAINPMGAVPALKLDDGTLLTEAAIVLQYLASRAPAANLAPSGDSIERWKFLETLNFIATELHKGFGILFAGPPEEFRAKHIEKLKGRLQLYADRLGDKPYVAGDHFTVADAYAFVILTWAKRMGVEAPASLNAYYDRIAARPAVQQTLKEEGLA